MISPKRKDLPKCQPHHSKQVWKEKPEEPQVSIMRIIASPAGGEAESQNEWKIVQRKRNAKQRNSDQRKQVNAEPLPVRFVKKNWQKWKHPSIPWWENYFWNWQRGSPWENDACRCYASSDLGRDPYHEFHSCGFWRASKSYYKKDVLGVFRETPGGTPLSRGVPRCHPPSFP